MTNLTELETAPKLDCDFGVFSELVGQHEAVAELRRAIQDVRSMTHAWLFTGPPGSGRSNMAKAFAAGLQCDDGGCGKCQSCRTVLAGTHPDVTLVQTQRLSIGVDEIRELVRKSALSPGMRKYQIIIVEDADRITIEGANALLKGLEEPSPRTIWMLCAPNENDVVVTVRSRCRKIHLVTPAANAVSALLQSRDGVEQELADWAAKVSQGHIGRARHLGLSEQARQQRKKILSIPVKLGSLTSCLMLANQVVSEAKNKAGEQVKEINDAEMADLKKALGVGVKGSRPKNTAAAIKALEDEQKARQTRFQRDSLDEVLTELITWYRDVLIIQTGVDSTKVINSDCLDEIIRQAKKTTPEKTLNGIDNILMARSNLDANVAPLLTFENLLVVLGQLLVD